jgi:PIN domain nuclease of toxin-antitoxin system
MLNLDTHVLLFAASGSLTGRERRILEHDTEWSISAIVLWEIEMLYHRGRIQHGLDHPPLAALLSRVRIWPLSVKVCIALRSLDFESDPADKLIAATSIAHRVPLVTRDKTIRRSKRVRCL